MLPLTAVVLGATGFIGEQLVQQLLNDPAFSKVRILVRRPVELSHPKLDAVTVDFNLTMDYKNKLGQGDCIFCCIGTTQKQVKGDNALYRKIDFDIPVFAAKFGLNAGFKKYLLVSSVGANASSKNFYLRLKGEVENAIAAVGYPAFHVFRPSMLLGKRKEFRLAETIGKGIMQGLSFLFVGALKKYRGIQGADVAKAMVAAAKTDVRGKQMYEYNEMITN
jgi:uncharacterized protein YbjT (DUF2867 family)